MYDANKSSVVHAATLRARNGKGAALFPGPPVLGMFSFGRSRQTNIIVIVLANPVDHGASIKTLHPCVIWAIVEQTEISSIPWQRIGQANPGGANSPAIPNRFVLGLT